MTRRLLALVGIVTAAYGLFLLFSRQDLDRLTNLAVWLGAGVVLHDFVLAPLVIVVVALVSRVLPGHVRLPALVGFVVLGSLTLVAVPVLGRFGARPDNATLLDRPYVLAWFVLLGLTLLAVGAASLVRARRRRHAGPAT